MGVWSVSDTFTALLPQPRNSLGEPTRKSHARGQEAVVHYYIGRHLASRLNHRSREFQINKAEAITWADPDVHAQIYVSKGNFILVMLLLHSEGKPLSNVNQRVLGGVRVLFLKLYTSRAGLIARQTRYVRKHFALNFRLIEIPSVYHLLYKIISLVSITGSKSVFDFIVVGGGKQMREQYRE